MDEKIPEPLGAAHTDPMSAFPAIKKAIMDNYRRCAQGPDAAFDGCNQGAISCGGCLPAIKKAIMDDHRRCAPGWAGGRARAPRLARAAGRTARQGRPPGRDGRAAAGRG